MKQITLLAVILLATDSLVAQNDWTMISGNRERTSWSKNETILEPPFTLRVLQLPPPLSTLDKIIVQCIAYTGGALYLGVSHNPNLLATFDPVTGISAWQGEIEGSSGGVGNSPVIAGDRVILGGQLTTAKLTCFDRQSGTVHWRRGVMNMFARSAVVDGSRLYLCSDSVYCLDVATGRSIWTIPLGDYVAGSSAIDDQAVYYNYQDTLFARNKLTGTLIWAVKGAREEGLALDDQNVYVTATNAIRAVRKTDGTEIWRHTIPDGVNAAYIIGNAIAIDDTKLLYGVWEDIDAKGTIAALDKQNGSFLWRRTLPGAGLSAPTIANGFVYLTCWEDQSLWCFDAMTGNTGFTDTSHLYTFTQPIVVDGSLYAAAVNPDSIGFSIIRLTHNPTGIGEGREPLDISLRNYPNPFSERTRLVYSVPKISYVRMELLDLLGRSVSILVEGWKEVGTHEEELTIPLTGRAAGTYFLRLTTPDGSLLRPLSLLR